MDRKRILLVDDDEDIRLLYKEELEEEGFDVDCVLSGEEALKRLEEEALYHLILLDIRMSGMDGIAALRKIKERWEELPVILCSCYHHYKQEFGTWASDGYVVKSSDLTELKEQIKMLLEW
ncbi:MAG: response regulator [Thermodesulfobacteriota bacterium]